MLKIPQFSFASTIKTFTVFLLLFIANKNVYLLNIVKNYNSKKDFLNAYQNINDNIDTAKLNLLLFKANQIENFNPDSAIVIYKVIINTSRNESLQFKDLNNYYIAKCHYQIGFLLKKQNQLHEAISHFQSSATAYKAIDSLNSYVKCKFLIASCIDNLGDTEKAINSYFETLEIYETLNDTTNIALCHLNIGLIFRLKGLQNKAIYHYKLALQYGEQIKNYAIVSKSLNNLGVQAYNTGNYPLALQYYEKSLKAAELLGDSTSIARAYTNIGLYYSSTGDNPLALKYYNQALAIKEASKDVKDLNVLYNLIGTMYYEQSNYKNAFKWFEKSMDASILNGNKNGLARAYLNLGVIYDHWDSLYIAIEMYNKALEIRKSTSNSLSAAMCYNNIGAVYFKMKDYDKALEYYLISKKIKDSIGYSLGVASSFINIGKIYKSLGQYDSAENYILKAIEIEKNIGVKAEWAFDLNELISVLLVQQKYDEALPYLIKSRELNTSLLKSNFSLLSEEEKLLYLSKVEAYFQLFATYAWLNNNINDSITGICYDNEILLKNLLLQTSKNLYNLVYQSQDSFLIETFQQLRAVKDSINNWQHKSDQESQALLDHWNAQANDYERILVQAFSDVGQNLFVKEYKWSDVRNALTDKEIIIEFIKIKKQAFYSDEENITHQLAAIIILNNLQYPKLIEICDYDTMVTIINKGIQNGKSALEKIYQYESEYSAYKYIWSKIEPYCANIENIYIVPTGILNSINFFAIQNKTNKYISDSYNIRLFTNSSNIIKSKEQDEKNISSALLIGGIDYSFANSLASDNYWYYLPGTQREIELIKDILKRKVRINCINKDLATETKFKEIVLADKPDIIHLATHGFTYYKNQNENAEYWNNNTFIKNSNPLFRTGLLFAKANKAWSGVYSDEDNDDGILTAYEIANLNLSNTNLVVLSACETGIGEYIGNEGVYGLQRAFKIAGAKYLIVSLWEVPDKETTTLMKYFYKYLKQNNSIPLSFKLAQNQMKKYYSPYYWGGFVLLE